ncbi:ADP-ribosylglycohydrolase family protein [Gryllotalpicola koreensis]|uniref:ADP-ribosylglycohydrolase family protein n=2 Tax=Gryllotalpicola koreensis TaxID=993086 RepID=A0ABP8A039_9MICO
MRLSWTQPEDLLIHELAQSAAEGKDISAIREIWISAGGSTVATRNGASPAPASTEQRRLAARLIDELDALPAPPDEARPATLPAIEADGRALPKLRMPGDDLADRIHGAWLGRAAGCLLGKPVEKLPPEGIREILSSTGRWPLRGYFTAQDLPADVAARWPWNRRSATTSLVENISGMPEDDDLNYPILNLALLESAGLDFTVDDVAQAWLDNLPAGRVFTAERIAYRNLLEGTDPGLCGRTRNPFREWIGALIRADVYGWVSPGDPRRAARMAYEDARLSHTGDGIHGAMWVAGMSAAAVVADSVDEVLDAGAAVIPTQSALAAAADFGRDLAARGGALDDGLAELADRFAGVHWVHVLNNAATISWALSRGGGHLETSAPLAVMAGWDTDSAGATVGALAGALSGRGELPGAWIDPLDDRIRTSLPGLDGVRISDLAERTLRLAEQSRNKRNEVLQ